MYAEKQVPDFYKSEHRILRGLFMNTYFEPTGNCFSSTTMVIFGAGPIWKWFSPSQPVPFLTFSGCMNSLVKDVIGYTNGNYATMMIYHHEYTCTHRVFFFSTHSYPSVFSLNIICTVSPDSGCIAQAASKISRHLCYLITIHVCIVTFSVEIQMGHYIKEGPQYNLWLVIYS